MAKPASPELMAELDGRMVDVYSLVIEYEFDEDMSEEERGLFYWLLRLAYAVGRHDGALEVNEKYNPVTYKRIA